MSYITDIQNNFTDNKDTGECYFNFNAPFNQHTITQSEALSIFSKLDMAEIIISASLGGGKVLILESRSNAMCFSFGIKDYTDLVKNYTVSCETKTFDSEGKVYLWIIKKQLLQKIVDATNQLYTNQCGQGFKQFYLRISNDPNTLSNYLPSKNPERYLKVDLQPSTVISNDIKIQTRLGMELPDDYDKNQLLEKIDELKKEYPSLNVKLDSKRPSATTRKTGKRVKINVPGNSSPPPIPPDQSTESKSDKEYRPITYYQETYKMGECVVALNQYREDHPDDTMSNYVFRMSANKTLGNYEGTLETVFFSEKFGDNDLNNHVFIRTKEGLVIDPLFGIENMKLDSYVKHMINNNLVKLKDNYKEIIFDIQELQEKHRKDSRSQYISNDPCISMIYNIETKKCIFIE